MPGKTVKRTWHSNLWLDAPAKFRRACHYEAFIPDRLEALPLSLPAATAGVLTDADAFIRRLNDSAAEILAPLAHLLLRTESIASSKIEGLQVGARQLARADVERKSGGTVGFSTTVAELLDNIEAMELAVGEGAAAALFGVGDIVRIHERLMAHAPNAKIGGQIRSQQNWIGGNDYNPCGADFVPPPPEELDRLLGDLCAAINDDALPPLVQSALVHSQFETIHPFADGNGRTGRALIHVVLRRRGVAPRVVPPISVVFAGDRERYIAGLTAFRGNGVVKWVEQFAVAAARAAALADGYVREVMRLRDIWWSKLRESSRAPRAGAAAWAIIDQLLAYPVVSAQLIQQQTGRANAAVYQGIDDLVAAGVLVPTSGSKRNRTWEAAGLLPIIERLDAGEWPG